MAAGDLGVGGEVDEARLHRLPVLQLGGLAAVDGGVAGEVEDHALRQGQLQKKGALVEIQGLLRGVLNAQIHFQSLGRQGIEHRHVGLGQAVGDGQGIRSRSDGGGGQVKGLARGPDVRQIPGPEFQHGFVAQKTSGLGLLAAKVEGQSVKGQAHGAVAYRQELACVVKFAGQKIVGQCDHKEPPKIWNDVIDFS